MLQKVNPYRFIFTPFCWIMFYDDKDDGEFFNLNRYFQFEYIFFFLFLCYIKLYQYHYQDQIRKKNKNKNRRWYLRRRKSNSWEENINFYPKILYKLEKRKEIKKNNNNSWETNQTNQKWNLTRDLYTKAKFIKI